MLLEEIVSWREEGGAEWMWLQAWHPRSSSSSPTPLIWWRSIQWQRIIEIFQCLGNTSEPFTYQIHTSWCILNILFRFIPFLNFSSKYIYNQFLMQLNYSVLKSNQDFPKIIEVEKYFFGMCYTYSYFYVACGEGGGGYILQFLDNQA